MAEAKDLPGRRVDEDLVFLLLEWPEKAHFPKPGFRCLADNPIRLANRQMHGQVANSERVYVPAQPGNPPITSRLHTLSGEKLFRSVRGLSARSFDLESVPQPVNLDESYGAEDDYQCRTRRQRSPRKR